MKRWPSRCLPATKILHSWQLHRQGQFLEQAEQFEHDYDNDNYSDYVEDASVHAEDYQSGYAVASILCKLSGPDGLQSLLVTRHPLLKRVAMEPLAEFLS